MTVDSKDVIAGVCEVTNARNTTTQPDVWRCSRCRKPRQGSRQCPICGRADVWEESRTADQPATVSSAVHAGSSSTNGIGTASGTEGECSSAETEADEPWASLTDTGYARIGPGFPGRADDQPVADDLHAVA